MTSFAPASTQRAIHIRREEREPDTMLFLGSFRHLPNQEDLNGSRAMFCHGYWNAAQRALVVIGSDPPPRHSLPGNSDAIELVGFVDDVMEPLRRYALFVCPILVGSGVRVKLLEAFASGIPVVSTRIGAEGLAANDGEICELADDPNEFAQKVIRLLSDQREASALAQRARENVIATRDMRKITYDLEQSYRLAVEAKRRTTSSAA